MTLFRLITVRKPLYLPAYLPTCFPCYSGLPSDLSPRFDPLELGLLEFDDFQYRSEPIFIISIYHSISYQSFETVHHILNRSVNARRVETQTKPLVPITVVSPCHLLSCTKRPHRRHLPVKALSAIPTSHSIVLVSPSSNHRHQKAFHSLSRSSRSRRRRRR